MTICLALQAWGSAVAKATSSTGAAEARSASPGIPATLLAGEVMALAYSGYREEQHPDRGDGAVYPSDHEILEDRRLLVDHGFGPIRLYDVGEKAERGIALAREQAGIIVSVNVGNEALVDWTDHLVPLENVICYVREVKAAIDQPVTVAENYEWWIRDGAPPAAE